MGQSSLTNGKMKISAASLIIPGLLYLKCSSALEDVTGRHSVHQYQHRDLPPSNTRGITSSFFPLLLSWGIFFTGTKWCGAGNIAANSTDLGTNYQTDVCCRDHDFCTDIMPAGTCKYGICNNSSFTRSKCECDEQFRSCLGNSTETASTFVGLIFFNYVAIDCYEKVEPDTNCSSAEKQQLYDSAEDSEEEWCFVSPFPFRKEVIQQESNKTTSRSTFLD